MAPPTDFLLPRFETYSTGENADYGTLLTAVRKSASRDQRFRRRSRTERQSSRPEVVQYELGLSLGIVEDNGWGTHDKSLTLNLAVDLSGISGESRVRFRSARLWSPERYRRARYGKPAVLFLSAIPRVILLVFVLASAAIDDKSDFKFKWLWY